MKRRTLIKMCGASMMMAQLAPMSFLKPGKVMAVEEYGKVRLLDKEGNPLKASTIPAHTSMIFHYPYKSTPCFLLNLEKAVKKAQVPTFTDSDYTWPGGVGKNNSIVAFTAICSHNQTHPKQGEAQIRYEPDRGAIHCCSHKSDFWPAAGGALNADGSADISNYPGAAEEPLAAIILEWDEATDEILAKGVIGPEFFRKFFRRFRRDLRKQYGSTSAAKESAQQSRVMLFSEYSGDDMVCKEEDED